ncbi:MAG: PadR family transcriptional regulator [Clostridia bacterium]|nr:PadR family transcriptional regulator [Oscillospiraceae bacterium]MBR6748133.1 PadR family transcriptional regulator [Clostridia bacterium]
MDPQMKKGFLDACVLAVVEKEDAYGYNVTQQTINLLHVSESSLYPVLRRLEQQGCFETYNAEHGGRLRKYYHMTELGRQRLAQLRSEMNDLKKIVEFIMADAEGNEEV